MRGEWFFFGMLCSCTPLQPLVLTGFDTELPAEGLWIDEALEWAPGHPQFGERPGEKHHFVLAPDGLDCGFLQRTWDQGGAVGAYSDAVDRGAPASELCELDRAVYLERAQGPYQQSGLVVILRLLQPVLDEAITGIAPESGTFYERENPEASELAYDGYASWNNENWPQRVADGLDCASENPWGDLPTGPDSIPLTIGGPIEVDPGRWATRMELQLQLYDEGDPAGTIQGSARFKRCRVESVVNPQPPEG